MALDREYNISASSHACQGCARTFGVGDEYYSAVLEVEGDEMFARHDDDKDDTGETPRTKPADKQLGIGL